MQKEHLKKVFIIDDQENWRFALRILLEGEGYQVLEAASFEEAQKILEQTAFDLVILDVRLADEDTLNVEGLALLQMIKKQNRITQTIVLTGYPDQIRSVSEADAVFYKVPQSRTFDSKNFKQRVHELLTI